jgi:ketosteroid isomerase-like protein
MNPSAFAEFIDRLLPAYNEGDPSAAAKEAEAANVARLVDMYRAIGRGDFAAALDLFANDMDMEIIGPSAVPISGRWRGKDQVAAALVRNFSLFEDQRPRVQSVVAQGDTVVVMGHETGRYRPTGRTYELHWVQFFTFRDGQLTRFRELADTAVFLDAVNPRGPGPATDAAD